MREGGRIRSPPGKIGLKLFKNIDQMFKKHIFLMLFIEMKLMTPLF